MKSKIILVSVVTALSLPVLAGFAASVKAADGQDIMDQLQGLWRSTDDPKVVLEFRGNAKAEHYDGEKDKFIGVAMMNDCEAAGGRTDPNGEYLVEVGEDMCWHVAKVGGKRLELIYMARGNTLHYKRIGGGRVGPVGHAARMGHQSRNLKSAVTNWGNGKAYMFYDTEYLRFDIHADKVDGGYPKLTTTGTWPGLSFETIDAAVNWGNGKGYLFSGNRYVRYDIKTDRADRGYPKRINTDTWPGLPFTTIDAAVNWGNGKAYFFSGTQYARYNIRKDRMDQGYPKQINSNTWPGLPFDTIDAVVNWGNGKAYLFSGDQYVRYDIKADRADGGYPKQVNDKTWPGMPW